MTLFRSDIVNYCGCTLATCILTTSVHADEPPPLEPPPPAPEPVAVQFFAPPVAVPMLPPAQAPVAVWQVGPQIFARPANFKDAVKQALETTLAARIGEIRRTCNLEQEQIADLETAAKGVVELATRPAEDDEQPEDKTGDGVVAIYVSPATAAGTAQARKGYEEIWPKAVRRVLNDEQEKRLDEARKRRRERHQQAAVTSCAAMIDRIVCLSDEQRDPVLQVVADVVKQQFADRSIQQITGAAPQAISVDRFQDILDETQIKTWEAWKSGRLTVLEPLPQPMQPIQIQVPPILPAARIVE